MEFTGKYAIAAPPERVWDALNDPEILQACIPGCERLRRSEANRFDAVAALRIGPVKARFKAVVEQSELDPPRRCVLKGEGLGGVAGFARGQAEVQLAQQDDATLLSYTARASVGGKLAQISQRLIDGAARQIADDFFARFAARMAGSAAGAEARADEPPPVIATTEAVVPPAASRREGLAPQIWVVGLVAVIVILLVLFGVTL